mmetsp:Transcript_35997/g.103525  ORF Transcript_35997/g.103525 Transcript_35997/m.103525 type:complete len:210 (-) Transcript_35997:341-970(-)
MGHAFHGRGTVPPGARGVARAAASADAAARGLDDLLRALRQLDDLHRGHRGLPPALPELCRGFSQIALLRSLLRRVHGGEHGRGPGHLRLPPGDDRLDQKVPGEVMGPHRRLFREHRVHRSGHVLRPCELRARLEARPARHRRHRLHAEAHARAGERILVRGSPGHDALRELLYPRGLRASAVVARARAFVGRRHLGVRDAGRHRGLAI